MATTLWSKIASRAWWSVKQRWLFGRRVSSILTFPEWSFNKLQRLLVVSRSGDETSAFVRKTTLCTGSRNSRLTASSVSRRAAFTLKVSGKARLASSRASTRGKTAASASCELLWGRGGSSLVGVKKSLGLILYFSEDDLSRYQPSYLAVKSQI